ncbi:MAG TPA: chromosome partitioning protein ParB, partial [Allocoleopsis sp.]
LNLPPKILDVLRQGKLEYSKARTIAQVKDDKQRNELLKQAIAKGLSLNQIRERVQASKADLDPEMMPQQVLFSRMSEIAKQLKRSKAWTNRRKCDRITKLLDELERLTSED